MQLSCLSVSLFSQLMDGSLSLGEWARFGKELGLDAVDIGVVCLKNHAPKYLREVRSELEEAGLGLCMITTSPDFSHPDATQRERELESLRHDIAIASQVGARFLRVTAGQAHPETAVDQGVGWVVDKLRAASDVADKFGVTLVYEDHSKPGAWDYMDFSLQPEIFLRVVDGVRGSSVRVNFDTANILVAGHDTTVEVLEQVLDLVETIHVAETAEKGKMAPVQLGTGVAPIRDVFACLKKNGWDKWLNIEEWGNNGREGVRQAVGATRQLWREA